MLNAKVAARTAEAGMKNDLFLFFPQWQGSGLTSELHASACTLKRACPSIPFREVPVATHSILVLRHGILGYNAIIEQQEAAHRIVEEANPRRIFSLGGDCGLEIVPVSFLNQKYDGKLAVIWLDAHGDLNTPEVSPSKLFHGMPLRFLLASPPHSLSNVCFTRLNPSQVLLAGARLLDEAESRYIYDTGILRFHVTALEADPTLLCRQPALSGALGVYLHIDLDVLDPSEFPNVKCPVSRGLRLETLRSLIQSIKNNSQVVGCSILEFVANRDEASTPAIRDLIYETIGDWLDRRPERMASIVDRDL
jgi:arginase